MARATAAVPWRLFLRAMAEEIDQLSDIAQRNELLRRIGYRMAMKLPLSSAQSLDGLETEINNALAALEWGEAKLYFDENDRSVRIAHMGLPEFGSLGPWLASALVGLYGAWLAQQPGADPNLVVERLAAAQPGVVLLRYARAQQ